MQRFRNSLKGLTRYIVIPETSKHRIFTFLDAVSSPDDMLIARPSTTRSSSAFCLAAFTLHGP